MSTYSQSHKTYYEQNKEKLKNYAKDYINLKRQDYKSYLKLLCSKAKCRKKDFNLVPEDLYKLWDLQNGQCAYSGMPLVLEAHQLETVSLDRINSSIGYVNSNVQLVCAIVNRMKQEFPEEDFLRYCALITNKTKITYSN